MRPGWYVTRLTGARTSAACLVMPRSSPPSWSPTRCGIPAAQRTKRSRSASTSGQNVCVSRFAIRGSQGARPKYDAARRSAGGDCKSWSKSRSDGGQSGQRAIRFGQRLGCLSHDPGANAGRFARSLLNAVRPTRSSGAGSAGREPSERRRSGPFRSLAQQVERSRMACLQPGARGCQRRRSR